MTDDKKSIIVYSNWISFLNHMTMCERGQLFTALLQFANGSNGDVNLTSPQAQMAFDFMKSQIERDTEKWKDVKEKRSRAGKAGMNSRWGGDK